MTESEIVALALKFYNLDVDALKNEKAIKKERFQDFK